MAGEPTLYARMELRLTDAEKRMVKFQQQIDRSMGVMEKRTQRAAATMEQAMAKSANSMDARFAAMTRGFATAAAGLGSLSGFKSLVDAATRTENALKVAGLSGTALADVYAKLFKSAQDSAVPIESLVELFGRASNVQKELGVSTEQLLGFTNNVAKALRVAGTDASAASGALLQLSQALGSGTVRAEEFNSIQEAALPILQAVAAGIKETGGSVSKLRQMVIDGRLSSQQFFQAFEKGAVILDQRLKGSVLTIEQAFTRLRNSLQDAAGRIDDTTGASGQAVDAINQLSRTVDGVAKIFEASANGPLGKYIEKLSEINELVQKIIPGIDGLKNLPENIDNVANFLKRDPQADAQSAATRAAEDLAQRIESSVPRRLVSSEEQRRLDDVVKRLREGVATAEEIEEAFAGLGPKFQPLAAQLKPFIDALRDAVEQANMLEEIVVPTINPRPASEGALEAQRAASADRFLQERAAIELRTEKEKELAALTEKLMKDAKAAGQAITEAEAAATARATIAKQTAIRATDSAVSGFVDRVVGAESAGDPNAKNPLSTATGLGQFIESTWIDQFRKNFPDRAANMSREAILAMRSDAATSRQLIESYARENAAVLQAAGISVSGAADEYKLQLAHFLGPQGAINILKAAPSAPVSGLLDAGAIKANQSILGGGATAGDVIAYAQKRAGMTTPGTQAIDSRESFEKQLEQERQRIELLKQETGLRAQLNPLVNDYGRAMSEIEKASELLRMAQEEGTAAGKELSSVQQLLKGDLSGLTPEAQKQALAMRDLAASHGTATAAGNQLAASQEQLKTSLAESSALGKDVFGGMIRDMRDGASAAEILHNALIKISDKLIDMSLTRLFDGAVAGSGQGLLGGLFKGLLFDEGGYTGPGAKHDVAGLVHAGEYVVPKKTVDKLGVPALEAMFRGYADGGPVMRAPSMPSIAGLARPAVNERLLIELQDDTGRMASIADQRIQTRSGMIVDVAIKKTRANVTNWVREDQMRYG